MAAAVAIIDSGGANIASLLFADAAMRGRRRMNDRRFDIAQICGDRTDANRVNKTPCCRFAIVDGSAAYTKCHYATETALLFRRQCMLRMRFEPCIKHALDTALLLQPVRQFKRIFAVCVHP